MHLLTVHYSTNPGNFTWRPLGVSVTQFNASILLYSTTKACRLIMCGSLKTQEYSFAEDSQK